AVAAAACVSMWRCCMPAGHTENMTVCHMDHLQQSHTATAPRLAVSIRLINLNAVLMGRIQSQPPNVSSFASHPDPPTVDNNAVHCGSLSNSISTLSEVTLKELEEDICT
ncbi:Origin recognition complex subunit 3, partial [Dissostichus eleginoides]